MNRVATHSKVVQFHKEIAQAHKEINGFYRFDITELTGKLRSGVQTPVLMLESHSTDLEPNANKTATFANRRISFVLLDFAGKVDNYDKKEAVLDCLEVIALDVCTYLKKCSDDRTHWLYGMVDLQTVQIEKVGPILDNMYGWNVIYTLKNKETMCYDADNWEWADQEVTTNTPTPPPPCQVPVVSGIPNNQFIDQILVSVGVTKTWQIIGSNNPNSYDVVFGNLQGVTVNQQTGIVSYTPLQSDLDQAIPITFKAINDCGVGSLLRFLKPVANNVSVLNAPINQSFYNVNPPQQFPIKSFNYQDEVLPYDGTISAYEVWVKGGIYPNWTLYASYTGSNLINNIGMQQTFIPCGQVADTYLVKTRLKNSNNEYSAYTPELSVIVP